MDEPLQPVAARKLIQRILEHGEVFFTPHALDEMAEDGLIIEDIERTLRSGQVLPGEWEHGEWRYRVRRYEVVAVVAFESEVLVIVVTAWKGRR